VRPDALRIRDMLFALRRIRDRCPDDLSTFEADEMVQVWVVHHLQMLGEAAARVSPETRQLEADIPWTEMNALRNVIVHQYFGIDIVEIWNTVWNDALPLQPSLEELLQILEVEDS